MGRLKGVGGRRKAGSSIMYSWCMSDQTTHIPGEEPSSDQNLLWSEKKERHLSETQVTQPSNELVIPNSLQHLRKAVAVIHSVPVRAEHAQSLNTRRLIDALLLIVQSTMKKSGEELFNRVKSERVSPLFETRVTDLARLAQIPGKNYERVYESLNKIYEIDFRWNVVGESQEVELEMKSHLLSSIAFGVGKKNGLIQFSIDPSLLVMIVEPSMWATLNLVAMPGLNTSPSYALYQNCWRYVTTHAKVTAALPTSMWIELLVGPDYYMDVEPDGTKTPKYGDFKRKVLLPAIEKVNENVALSYRILLLEHKVGKRVSKLQFKFEYKEKVDAPRNLFWDDDIIKTLNSIGFDNNEIRDLSESQSMTVVAEALIRLKEGEDKKRLKGERLTSRKAYFLAILTNVSSDLDWSPADLVKIEEESNRLKQEQEADKRKKRRAQQFEEHRWEAYVANLFALQEEERLSLFNEFETSNEGRGAEVFIKKGWAPTNRPLLAIFRKWLGASHEALMAKLTPLPQDQTLEAWMAWKLDQAVG